MPRKPTEVQAPRGEHAAAAVHREVPPLVRASPAKASPSHGRDLPRPGVAMFLLWIHRNSSRCYPTQVTPFGNLRVNAVVGTNRWRVLRRSSIFQDALGDSDGNKKYFRFSGISRTSPNDLIAVLEREHTAPGRSQAQFPKKKPTKFDPCESFV
jgi:hypothetical protein